MVDKSITEYKLEDVVAKIEEISNQISNLDSKFKQEYLIGNITEQDLLDVGFTFKEYSSYSKCPIYTMGNIVALFKDNVLHVML